MPSIVPKNQIDRLLNRAPDESSKELLKERRLNDFYVRKSLKRWLDSIEDINTILDNLPLEQLDKNEILKADMVFGLFKIVEKLVKEFDPSPYASRDEEGKNHIFRWFRVDMSGKLPGMVSTFVNYKIKYEATKEEVEFFQRLTDHTAALEEIWRYNERHDGILTPEEMEIEINSIVKGRPYTATIEGITGVTTEETQKEIMSGNKPVHEILPMPDDIDLKKAQFKNYKEQQEAKESEEPK